MENYNSLTYLLTLPLAAMVISWLIPKAVQRLYAIFASIVILAVTVYEAAPMIFTRSSAEAASMAVEQKLSWIPDLGMNLSLRLDSTSIWFIVLNALTAVIVFSLRGSWFRKYARVFTSLGFFLVFALNAAFLSTDLVVFYLAYEAVFIPMIFMTGIWGENQKASSVFRFFIMSFFGSILMLVSIFYLIYLYHAQTGSYSSNLEDLLKLVHSDETAFRFAFLGFFLAFAIKVPLVPFHGWLKEVYVNSPMPGTIWMSAVLSKLGVFGFIRFVLPLFPECAVAYQGWFVTLSAISVLYAALLAIRSNEPKELLAYSSISHLGFVMLGVFSLKSAGTTSAILLSLGHGVVSSMLFYLLHQVDERREHLGLEKMHGLARTYPTLFVAFFVGVLASVSLPGTLNFCGEFLVLLNAYPVSVLCTILSGVGVIFGAVYMLKFYQQLGFGKETIEVQAQTVGGLKDLGGYDLVLLLCLIAILVYGGFQPAIFLKGF